MRWLERRVEDTGGAGGGLLFDDTPRVVSFSVFLFFFLRTKERFRDWRNKRWPCIDKLRGYASLFRSREYLGLYLPFVRRKRQLQFVYRPLIAESPRFDRN